MEGTRNKYGTEEVVEVAFIEFAVSKKNIIVIQAGHVGINWMYGWLCL